MFRDPNGRGEGEEHFVSTEAGAARAEACANIALAKYWGKSDQGRNLTAVPSLSLTLDGLRTRTEVVFDDTLQVDSVSLDGKPVVGRPLDRVVALLDRTRALGSEKRRARVTSLNNFPTAAGLASSASGFAALAMAATRAAGVDVTRRQLSSMARQSSASAARSLYGGFAELRAETESAEPVAPVDHWDLTMLVAVVEAGPKPIGSTGGMVHTKETSPYYPTWVAEAPALFETVRSAVLEKDFSSLCRAMEQSTLMMHATMMAADPPVLYFRGATLEIVDALRRLRDAGLPVGFTMDAGPNVKVLTPSSRATEVAEHLATLTGVASVIHCKAGPAARYLALDGPLNDAGPLDVAPDTGSTATSPSGASEP